MKIRPVKCAMLFIPVFLLMSGAASADTPYRSFTRTEWYSNSSSPDAFVPIRTINGKQMDCGLLDQPQDIDFAPDGTIYIADRGNHRIVALDRDLHYVRDINAVTVTGGGTESFYEPTSVFAADDGTLYIADTGNERCLRIDQNNVLLQVFTAPDDEAYTSETFKPIKISVDDKGLVYIISQNVYQGILRYNQQGEFEGFFGSPPVTASVGLLFDRFWKSILSEGQREGLSNYVPVEYTSMVIDKKGFVYAVQSYTDNNQGQMKRLNYYGNNVLSYNGYFGEKETVDYKRTRWYTKLIDVDEENGFIYSLDDQWQRINVYDQTGMRLMSFGTQGEQLGSFRGAGAVSVRNGIVYVLDRAKGSVTIFERTEYGDLIFEAVELYNSGEYSKAVGPWQHVLDRNANNEMAYNGIAEAELKAGNYAGAVKYFRLGYNRERESVAFGMLRSKFLRRNIPWVLAAMLALLAGVLLLTSRRFLRWVSSLRTVHASPRPAQGPVSAAARTAWIKAKPIIRVFGKPVEGFNELKHRQYRNVPFVIGTVFAWLIVSIVERMFKGFRFSQVNPEEFSLVVQLALTAIPFLLFAVTNWAVCAILNGEGKFGEIATNLSIALPPFLASTLITVLMTNVMTLKEQVLITLVWWVGALWSLLLLFHGQRIVHGYTSVKTVGAVVLTLLGIVAILVIALLLFALGQQVVYFVRTVYSELVFRK